MKRKEEKVIKHCRGCNNFLHTSISVYLPVVRDKIRAQVLFTSCKVARYVLRNFNWSRIITLNRPMMVTFFDGGCCRGSNAVPMSVFDSDKCLELSFLQMSVAVSSS